MRDADDVTVRLAEGVPDRDGDGVGVLLTVDELERVDVVELVRLPEPVLVRDADGVAV